MLNDHLAALAAGAAVPVPIYDYVQYNRSGDVRVVPPARIVVVEGILVLWEPPLRERFDLKVFVDTDADIRLIRRLRRDVAERGRTTESVIEQYLTTVRPAHEQFIEPSKRYADVIIPQGGLNRPAIDVLLARVARARLRRGHPRSSGRAPRCQDDAMTYAHPAFDNRVTPGPRASTSPSSRRRWAGSPAASWPRRSPGPGRAGSSRRRRASSTRSRTRSA